MTSGPELIRELLSDLGYKQGPILVLDNQALVDTVKRGNRD